MVFRFINAILSRWREVWERWALLGNKFWGHKVKNASPVVVMGACALELVEISIVANKGKNGWCIWEKCLRDGCWSRNSINGLGLNGCSICPYAGNPTWCLTRQYWFQFKVKFKFWITKTCKRFRSLLERCRKSP